MFYLTLLEIGAHSDESALLVGPFDNFAEAVTIGAKAEQAGYQAYITAKQLVHANTACMAELI